LPWRPRLLRGVTARTAFGVGLLMLILLLVVAHWGRQRFYDDQLADTRSLGQQEAVAILVARMSTAAPPSLGWFEALPYEIVGGNGVVLSSSTELKPFEKDGRPVMPVPGAGAVSNVGREWPVTFAVLPGHLLSGLSVTAVDGTIVASTKPATEWDGWPKGVDSPTTFRVYVFITPFTAQAARTRFDRIMWAGIPAAVALAAAVAAWLVRRPLRAVEAIRARTAMVTGASLQQRVPVPNSRDEIAALAGTINDTLARLEQSATSQRQFVADAAHELRSPIATMLATVQVARTHPTPSHDPEFLDRIERGTSRLRGLTDDLLLLARIDANEPPVFELVEIRSIVTAALRPPALLTDGPAVLVSGDARQLERAIGNLIDNAIRHADTRVTVSVATGRDTVRVTVHNDGAAIDPTDRERIFHRFVRLDAARARDRGGSGLGLAITREIARRHHGDVTTVPLRTGAQFILELPAAVITG
jgi:signal transduction histidine kinase